MSLDSGVSALATSVSGYVKRLRSARGLPSYAGDPSGPYLPHLGLYNGKASNMRKTHAGLMRALNGGKMNIAVIADSVGTGYNGTTVLDRNSFAQRMQLVLAGQLGVPRAGGFHAALAAINTSSDRWTLNAGTVNGSTYAGLLTLNASSGITFQTEQECTGFDLIVAEASASNFTYQLDGATAVAVTTTGAANTYKKVSIAASTLGYHNLRINSPTGIVFIVAVVPTYSAGIAMHNLSFGGSRAAGGTAAVNWTDTSAAQLYANHKLGFDALGITPDLVVCHLGGNDIFQGDAPATAIAGLSTIRGWYPTADFLLVGGMAVNGTNMTNFNDYWQRKYTLADTLDCPLLDIRTHTGDYTEAQANALLGSDNVHYSNGQNIEIGRLLATSVLMSAGGFSDFDPDTSGFVDRVRGGAEAVSAAEGTSGTVTLRAAGASVFTLTPTAAVTTLNIADVPATGKASTITLIVSQGATPYSIATPAGYVFLGSATPTQVANKKCVFTYMTTDGGSTGVCQGVVQV